MRSMYKQSTMTATALIAFATLLGCGGDKMDGGGDASPDGATLAACTAEDQNVTGTALTYSQVFLAAPAQQFPDRLLASAADVAEAFPAGDAPLEVANADFTMDRVVLGSSNPLVMFAVDDGARLVVGEEPLCQGAAPSGMAYIVSGTTQNMLEIVACPYRGPDPCLAP